ncbi:homoserine O-acetyltransferase MetA [Aerococcus urinae]
MPIKVQENLPALKKLASENIFVMDERRAAMQDFRSLEVIIVNLMPTKEATEEQLLRLLSNSALQVNVTFIHMQSHKAKNTSAKHLDTFYRTFDDIKDRYFDGMIITGAPVEQLDFEEVNYWDELVDIMEWSSNHVFSTLHICWGAQAGLYHHFGIKKYSLDHKLFGVYPQYMDHPEISLLRGLDDVFYIPHSRYTEVRREDIEANPDLEVLISSPETGITAVHSKDQRFVFIFGHVEYDADTLDREYKRDINEGIEIKVPLNYYPKDNPNKKPLLRWRSTSNMLFTNWLNYYVYQETPFVIERIDKEK